MSDDLTLLSENNTSPNEDTSTPVIRTALELMDKYSIYTNEKLDSLDFIQELIDSTFEVSTPSGLDQVNNFLIWQVLFTFVTRTKPLDVQLRAEWADEDMRRAVAEWVWYVLKEWWFSSMLRDWFWGFYKQYAYWDFFWMVWSDSKWLPEFRDASIKNVYFDSQATRLLSKTWNKATRCVVVFEYSWDNALKYFPWIETKASMWPLPTVENFDNNREIDQQDYEQKAQSNDRKVEIGFYYDITDEARFTVFAWPTAAILDDIEWEAYPFSFDNLGTRQDYIPVLQWMCHPTNEWILNAWWGHLIHNLSIQSQEILNKTIKYWKDNLDPIWFLNLPAEQAWWVMWKIANAQKIQRAWGKWVVINAFKEWEKQSGLGQMDTLQSPPFSWEGEAIMAMIDKQLQRFWIKLDLTFTDPRKPFATTALEEESFWEVIQQIQEQNTLTYEMVFKIAIDMIKKNIKDDDDTPLPIKGIVNTEGWEEAESEWLTLWMLAEELKAREYQIVVNSRTWVVTTNTLEKFYNASAIQDLMAIWDVQGARKLIAKKHALNWINIWNQVQWPQEAWAWEVSTWQWPAPQLELDWEPQI